MVKNADEIYNELKLIDMQCTGNCVEALDTYSVKSKRITLYVGRTQSGNSYRYAIGVVDVDTKESSIKKCRSCNIFRNTCRKNFSKQFRNDEKHI